MGCLKYVIKALFVWSLMMAAICFQGYLHNDVLKEMYPYWTFILLFFIDVAIGLSFFPLIVRCFKTRDRISTHIKKAPLATEIAFLSDTHTRYDVCFPIFIWMIYIIMLIVKVVLIFEGYRHQPDLLKDKNLSDHVQLATLLTAVVFFFQTVANSNAIENPEGNAFLVNGATTILFDLFDTTNILDLWFDDANDKIKNLWDLRTTGLVFHCISLLFPLVAVTLIFWSRYGVKEHKKNVEIWCTILRAFLINLPYLVLRCYIADYQLTVKNRVDFETTALIGKNCFVILYACYYFASEIWRIC